MLKSWIELINDKEFKISGRDSYKKNNYTSTLVHDFESSLRTKRIPEDDILIFLEIDHGNFFGYGIRPKVYEMSEINIDF